MASPARGFICSLSRRSHRIRPHEFPNCSPRLQQCLSTTLSQRANEPSRRLSTAPAAGGRSAAPDTSHYTSAQKLQRLVNELKDLGSEEPTKGQRGSPIGEGTGFFDDSDFEYDMFDRAGRMGFWAEGEEEMGPEEDYYGDDLTSLGHGELEKHRELREYARLIAWELPLLHQLARPFEPPTAATPFRFRYTSYLGESHPAVNKVVVEFSPSDLDLSPLQRDKLIKLAGVRYNPSTASVKLSCEAYDTQSQNKRSLGDTITKLIAEAKDGKDTFEDVPFDFRHHVPKKRYEFPKEWILTEERKQYLQEKRAKSFTSDDRKANTGLLIDGQKVIGASLAFKTAAQAEPVMVGGRRGRPLR